LDAVVRMGFQKIPFLAFLQLLNLFLEKLPQELAQLVHRYFSTLVFVEDLEDLAVPVIDEVGIRLRVHPFD